MASALFGGLAMAVTAVMITMIVHAAAQKMTIGSIRSHGSWKRGRRTARIKAAPAATTIQAAINHPRWIRSKAPSNSVIANSATPRSVTDWSRRSLKWTLPMNPNGHDALTLGHDRTTHDRPNIDNPVAFANIVAIVTVRGVVEV